MAADFCRLLLDLTCFHASFFPFWPLCWPPLFPPFLGTFFTLFSPSKSALFCRQGDTAQSLERGSFRMDLSTKFGKEIPSRNLRKKRSETPAHNIQEVSNRVSADGVRVKFPIFSANCSFQLQCKVERGEKRRKAKKKKKSEEKLRKAKEIGKSPSNPIYVNPFKNLAKYRSHNSARNIATRHSEERLSFSRKCWLVPQVRHL